MQFRTENGLAFTAADVEVLIERGNNNHHLLNEYSRYFYRQYIHIRNCCNPKKCKKVSLETVRERSTQEHYAHLIKRLLQLEAEQVEYVINFCEKYIQYI